MKFLFLLIKYIKNRHKILENIIEVGKKIFYKIFFVSTKLRLLLMLFNFHDTGTAHDY